MESTKVGVVGLGTMGSGIAQICIEGGIETVGCDTSPALCEQARRQIADRISRRVESGELDAMSRETAMAHLSLTTDMIDLAGCHFVVEAVFESLSLKQALFQRLEKVVDAEAILATNTSALSVTEIASAIVRSERVVGMHFFNPVTRMPLVEVVNAEQTGDRVVAQTVALAERLGKRPIRCSDTPGFVVNRILLPLLNDCVRVLSETGVSIKDLDTAMQYGAGWPMGPAALADLIGIDVIIGASQALYERLHDPRMAPSPRLVRMAAAGKLGRKSGRGFHSYAAKRQA